MTTFAAVKRLAGESEVFGKEVKRKHRINILNVQYLLLQAAIHPRA